MLLDHICEHLLGCIKANQDTISREKNLSTELKNQLKGGIYANSACLRMLINYHENYISDRVLDLIKETI